MTAKCILTIDVLTLMTWLPSKLTPADDRCLASLLWWTSKYSTVGLALASVLIFASLTSLLLVFIRLKHSTEVDCDQRVAAIATMYYLAVGIPLLVSISRNGIESRTYCRHRS